MFGVWLPGNLWNKDCLVSGSAISILMDFYFMTLFLIAFWTHSQLCPPSFMLQGIMKKRLFPFFAEAAGVKHKARYSQRAFKPTGHTWVHGTRQEAPKGAVELCGVHEVLPSSLRNHGRWGSTLVTGKSVLVDIQSSEVWTGWSAEIPSCSWDSVIVCLHRGVPSGVCQLFKTLHGAPLIYCLGRRNSAGRQGELFNCKLH